MKYLPNILSSGEDFDYVASISLWAHAGKLTIALALAVGGLYLFIDYQQAAAVLLTAASVLGMWVRFLQSSVELSVTNKRVLAKTGIVRRDVFELNLSKIEGAQINQSITGRILGYGTITIRGVGDPLPPISDISSPHKFHAALMAAAANWNRAPD